MNFHAPRSNFPQKEIPCNYSRAVLAKREVPCVVGCVEGNRAVAKVRQLERSVAALISDNQ